MSNNNPPIITFPKGDENPYHVFEEWFSAASQAISKDHNAMALSTASKAGLPMVRIVLLKYHSQEGFTFFTNYTSQKAKNLIDNPQAELNFYWRELDLQIRIAGSVEKTSEEVSFNYFKSRHRDSQIGAWASDQSKPLQSDEELQKRVKYFEDKFSGKEVDMPGHWGGFIVKPLAYEFWHQRDFRLHERIIFTRDSLSSSWASTRLFP